MAVARSTEITASSTKSIEAAIQEGLKRASKSLPNVTGLEVSSIRAKVEQGRVREYRVSLKVTFALEE